MISLQHLAGEHCRFLATSTHFDCSATQSWSVAAVTRSRQGWYSSALGNERRQRSTHPSTRVRVVGWRMQTFHSSSASLRSTTTKRLLQPLPCPSNAFTAHTPESRHTKPCATVKSGTRRRSLPFAKLVWPLLTALLCDDRVICDLQRKSIVCGTAGRPCADLAP